MPYKDRQKQLAAQKSHWENNKDKYVGNTRKRRIERAKWWHEYKLNQQWKCKECGESHPACVAFHHRNPEEKRMSVADLVGFAYSEKVILEEVAKCDAFCHNCHAKLHWEMDHRRRNDDGDKS